MSPGRLPLELPEGSVSTTPWVFSSVSPLMAQMLGPVDASSRDATGRWGEQLVATELTRAAAGTPFTIAWLNEKDEIGLPYDIEIRRSCMDAPDLLECYVEVKTTTSQEKRLFEVSPGEIDMARREQNRYAIYRVFGAGSEQVSISSLQNPAAHLGAGGGLTLYMGDGA